MLTLLELCTSIKELQQILPFIIKNGFYNERLFQTKLVSLFCKYGRITEASRVFERVEHKLDVLYHTMLKGYAKNSTLIDALSFYHRMRFDEVRPVVYDFTYLLLLCVENLDLKRGREIHGQLIVNGFQSNLIAMTAVVNLYAKCRQIEDAYKMFERIPKKDLVLWTTLVAGYAQNGFAKRALQLVLQMQEAGQKPNSVTLISVLPSVADIKALRIGREIHGYAFRSGFESLDNVPNALLDMYFKCGSVRTARLVFQGMSNKSVASWNTMIDGYVQNGEYVEVFATFLRMLDEGVEPTIVGINGALHACANLGDLEGGRFVHKLLDRKKLGCDVSVMNSLISMYSKCRQIEEAYNIFQRMPQKNLVSWNRLVSGYAQNGFARKAVQLVLQMQEAGQKPNLITLVSVLPAVADIKALRIGRSIHGYAFRLGCESPVNIANALLDMYFECGSIRTARLVFKGMSSKNVVSWNTLIDGYAQNGESEEAFASFLKMLNEGVEPTNVTIMGALHACANLGNLERGRFVHKLLDQKKLGFDVSVMNSLISMYSKCKRVDIAASVFNNLKQKTLVTWNATILGYAQNGCVNEALNLFCVMQSQDIKPDSFTLVSVITALADLSVTRQAKWIHGLAIRTLMDKNVFVATALVDMYAKCGAIQTARKLFDMMQERHVITWNVMIDGYGTHDLGKEALDLFNKMQKETIKPNDNTFLSVISVCIHSGLVEEGLYYFKSMKENYGLEPSMDHYSAIVDLLGRAGRLEDAWNFIQEMPVKPGRSVLGAMLELRSEVLWRYAFLVSLGDKLKVAGYVLDTNSFHDVEETVKEQLIRSHRARGMPLHLDF
ncbi:hypothetical protein VNO77_25938 [Canavalia gladiata]|uniref:Pentatricopeptide repeat-containing protein n=1 Tax=Canavalia gladiata TaxID=3824 RepID=A0AAN9KW68_CANGL